MAENGLLPPGLLERMAPYIASGQVKLPPPAFLELGGEVLAVDLEENALTVRFPVEERFQNPMGNMQGGIITALIDNTIGPLSFMVAPPAVTRELTTQYLRPVSPDLAHVLVTARFEGPIDNELLFTAEVRTEAGVILARATSRNVPWQPRQRSQPG